MGEIGEKGAVSRYSNPKDKQGYGKPQGVFDKETLEWTNQQAQGMEPGTQDFLVLPSHLNPKVYVPGVGGAPGTVQRGTHVYIKIKQSGVWHGYPRLGGQ